MYPSPSCRCCYQRHEVQNVECDDSNLDTTALSLAACVEENEYLFYASWEVRVYQSPFAILFDPSTNCVVVTIRGTLSIQVHLGSLILYIRKICTYVLLAFWLIYNP